MNSGDSLILERIRNGTLEVNINTGEVFSTLVLESRLGNKTGKYKLKGYQNKHGYTKIHLRLNGKSQTVFLHRIIWIAANDKIVPEDMTVDHINHCKTDNTINNLQLLTPSKNSSKRRNKKLSDTDIRNIRDMYLTGRYTINDIAEQYGVKFSYIGTIIRNENHIDLSYDPSGAECIRDKHCNYQNVRNLTKSDILKIMEDINNGNITQRMIAQKYNISRSTVQRIKYGRLPEKWR